MAFTGILVTPTHNISTLEQSDSYGVLILGIGWGYQNPLTVSFPPVSMKFFVQQEIDTGVLESSNELGCVKCLGRTPRESALAS